jgi:hypothetical protein
MPGAGSAFTVVLPKPQCSIGGETKKGAVNEEQGEQSHG